MYSIEIGASPSYLHFLQQYYNLLLFLLWLHCLRVQQLTGVGGAPLELLPLVFHSLYLLYLSLFLIGGELTNRHSGQMPRETPNLQQAGAVLNSRNKPPRQPRKYIGLLRPICMMFPTTPRRYLTTLDPPKATGRHANPDVRVDHQRLSPDHRTSRSPMTTSHRASETTSDRVGMLMFTGRASRADRGMCPSLSKNRE